jgi:hypothetical protein
MWLNALVPTTMFIQRSLVVLLFMQVCLARAASDVPLSALEAYASFAVKASQRGVQLTSEERFQASAYEFYLHGFFAGLYAAPMIYHKKDEDNKITGDISTVPEWMEDVSRSAPSFLAFVRRHCPQSADKDQIASRYVVHAWYVFEHPKAQIGERLGGLIALTDLCNWGPEFPDSEVLKKKLTENFVEKADPPKQGASLSEPSTVYRLEVGGGQIDMPSIPGLWRLDGRMPDLDGAVQKMAAAARNRVYLLLGTEADDIAISSGQFPTLERTITFQQSTRMDRLVPLDEFESLRDEMARTLSSKSPPESKLLFDQISRATSSALQSLTEPTAKAALGEPQYLGVFEKDESSLCHSILAPGIVRVAGKETKVIQATSIAIVYVNGRVLSVNVNAKYAEPADLAWTVDLAKLVRNKLLQR